MYVPFNALWLLPTLNLTFRSDILRSLSPYFPIIVYLTGLSGYGGLTVPLSLFLDIFSALTLHVSLSHLVLKNALSYQISALRSLFNLFRGTGESALRAVDSHGLPRQENGTMFCINAPTHGTMKWISLFLERCCSRYSRSAFRRY